MAIPAVLLLLLLLGACRGEPALFEERSARVTGIDFANTLQEDDSIYNSVDFSYVYNGAGVGVGDFDGDGLPDLYFAGNQVPNRLYLNRGDLRFEDVTRAAGVAAASAWSTGVAVVDIDQDGRLDLYVGVAGDVPGRHRANLLFVNRGADENGVPRFEERAEEYGIASTGYTTHSAFLDYDRDGDLDLYVLRNAEDSAQHEVRPRRAEGMSRTTDKLYRNDGGRFTDVSREAGIVMEGYGLGVTVSDLNQDGWPDIYVANDFQPNDLIWVNNRDGTFSNRAAEYLKVQSFAAMGVDIADINNDGLQDIVVVDMLPGDNFRQKSVHPGGGEEVLRRALQYGYEPQFTRNTLQLNNGPGPDGQPSFSEIGQLAGVDATDWSWAPLLADLDNDGFRDLFVTNGYPRDVTNLGYGAASNAYVKFGTVEERTAARRKEVRELPAVSLPNYLFRNHGDLRFADVSSKWGMERPGLSYGAAHADLDGDGDLDLVVNELNAPASVYENRSERLFPERRNFLRAELRGPAGNLGGYGAKVTIRHGGTLQVHEHTPYRGYQSSVEQTVHFGVGAARRVESVEIVWPDGRYQRLSAVPANQVIRLEHANAGERETGEVAGPARLFQAVSSEGALAVRHRERTFSDFEFTPLLPHKHSQGGPGIAVGDADGNGLDDAYVGTDRGEPKEILLQTAPGRFERRPLVGDTEYEDMGALFFDADGDGDQDLYVVSGGAYPAGDGRVYQDRLYHNDGAGRFRRDPDALPKITTSGSSVSAADFDRDGDLDLFVGGRIVPGSYPLPARSHLLRNDTRAGGPARFTDVTDRIAPGLSQAGLVTSALWTDFDGDERLDLVLVGEWMPITFFANRDGRFIDVTAETGLGATEGWWNSLVAGDFNEDGRTDYVAGNLGLNSRFRASEREPVRVHAADFDRNGTLDPVLSRFIHGKSYPVAARGVLVKQMLQMEFRFPTYAKYAEATLEQVLLPEERERALVARSVTFASSYVENLGGGKFAIRPLPVQAQLAPAFGMLARDHDGDGHLDLLMVGNSYAAEPQTGRHTASTGTVLLGDGKGGFRALSGARSGFHVDGDARGIAELVMRDGDSWVLVTQNDDSLRIFASTAASRRVVRLIPGDVFAVLTLADGTTRRVELSHGSTYLSQSSRIVRVPPGARSLQIRDSRGRRRTVPLP